MITKVFRATGAAAIASTWVPTKPSIVTAVKLHLSAAGGTSENFTITVDATTGVAYDILLLSQDMNVATDVLWIPDHPLAIASLDELDFAYTNTNSRTWALELTYNMEV